MTQELKAFLADTAGDVARPAMIVIGLAVGAILMAFLFLAFKGLGGNLKSGVDSAVSNANQALGQINTQ
ncbi:hypothetical protein [Ammonifex thiophilus]|uniref:Uncharacterized protein n=1 Tax=Ammonifex thiophilus TaxID=444093 RepID=A0A3D8P4B8_9THEO|nr:hypothetical protein [Ammonifex thiophilus]RDV82346.1 hypothetical protein DXX99_08005 [Ammonifex thiophilus]